MATTRLIQSNDPLLQPFQLKHLTLKNRIMSTAHEPNYHDGNGMPGERYRLYHLEKAQRRYGYDNDCGLRLGLSGQPACLRQSPGV